MSEKKPQNKKTDRTKCHLWHLWVALFVVFVVAIVCCFIWQRHLWNVGSIDVKFAAIDAELAIPDSENAAFYYRRFFTDPNNEAILYDLSDYAPSAYCEPWVDIEHPELADKLKKHSTFIQTLIDISEMQQARFTVDLNPDPDSWQMISNIRQLIFILSWAGANDLAEGRIDAAYSKYRCQMQLTRHFSQQPGADHKIIGIAFEAVAHTNIKIALMHNEITLEQLRALESILKIPMDRGVGNTEIAARIDRLNEEKYRSKMSMVELLKDLWFGRKNRKQQEQARRRSYLRIQTSRQVMPILIALRRHKKETGVWPETLEQIEPKLPGQMLTDPQNNNSFVYKSNGNDFIFYSKGPNGIDEGGSSSGSADDWAIWPRKIK